MLSKGALYSFILISKFAIETGPSVMTKLLLDIHFYLFYPSFGHTFGVNSLII